MKKIHLLLSICFLTITSGIAQNCTINLSSAVGTDAQEVCKGSSITDITYTVSGTGATVSSLPNGIIGSFTAGIFTISGASTVVGTFNYTVTTSGGCTPDGMVTGSIKVNGLPTITVTNEVICGGELAILTANGGSTYSWFPGGETGSTLATFPIMTTNYTVTGTTTTGCSASAIGMVTVHPTPRVTISSAAICVGNTATLTAVGAGSYTWSNGETSASLTAAPSVTTSYTVTGTSSFCSSSAVGTIQVMQIPVITATSATICAGGTTTLFANGGSTYSWMPGGSSGSSISVSPTTTSTYTVSENTPGCSASAVGTVTVRPLDNLPGNPGGCGDFYSISGNVFQDLNSNCNKDTSDSPVDNIHIMLFDANKNLVAHSYTTSGAYKFTVWDSAGTYTVEVDDEGGTFSSQCPLTGLSASVTVSNTNAEVDSVNFSLLCKNKSYGIKTIRTRGRVFPGQQHTLNIVAGNLNAWHKFNCTNGDPGTLKFTISGPVSFNGVPIGSLTPTVVDSTFTYTISDWSTVNISNDFKLYFKTDTTAQSWDNICVKAEIIAPTNNLSSNNSTREFCYRVRNSYDPNIKEVYPIDVEPGFEDWLNYTIHFQNTGDANAINIRLQDTLDANLELETFEVLGYSHPCTISLYENLLTVFYPNIELPDSASNPEGSQGHVQYRIKPKANLPLGSKINNTALIYFDFNDAIVTNTTVNEYKSITNISRNSSTQFVHIYPNPFDASFQIELEKAAHISIRNVLGSVIYSGNNTAGTSTIETSSFGAGIYFISIENNEGVITKKLIKN